MGWSVVLQGEKQNVIERIDEEFYWDILSEHEWNNRGQYILLKYLDPYGDAIFNPGQMDDLIADLERMKKSVDSNKLLIDKIVAMAVTCKNEVHTYIRFIGD